MTDQETPIPRAHVRHSKATTSSSSSPSSTSTSSHDPARKRSEDKEDEEAEEEDEYEKRIERTGCAAENEYLQMCYDRTRDWRQCQGAMQAFKDCWKKNQNVQAE